MKILTFDIEDWYHFLEHESTRTENQWIKLESRVMPNIEKILLVLEEKKQQATFFVMGWIAEKHPDLIKKINDAGHEIGLHSYNHQLIWQQTPKEFRDDVSKNIQIIEDQLGKKVSVYRAPGFSLKKINPWAIEILFSLGIKTDASIFPAYRAHGGISNFPSNGPCKISYQGCSLKELPVNYFRFAGLRTVFSGGGYFRFWPYSRIHYQTKNSPYVMTYLHPRDFDVDQPVLKDLSPVRHFRAYYGIKGTLGKLGRWIDDFEFIDVRTADKFIDWDNVPIIEF